MASQKVRTVQAMTDAVLDVTYGACSSHARHPNKAAARRTMALHRKAVAQGRPCWKCRAGRSLNIFACFDWQKHWHWGHC